MLIDVIKKVGHHGIISFLDNVFLTNHNTVSVWIQQVS